MVRWLFYKQFNMRRVIHQLRKLSYRQKQKISNLFILLAATLLIFSWVYSLGDSFNNPDAKIKMQNNLEPFNNLKDNLINKLQ